MKAKPETLAKRAVNEYRRRDPLAYASLRLYLDNRAALRDRWSREVASDLVLNQGSPSYNRIHYFKKTDKNECEFRDLYVPGPNEILAETALLGECARFPRIFQPPRGVYSYNLSKKSDSRGVYKYYFYGFHSRHRAISRACHKLPDSMVIYLDITRFYPSISMELAKEVWSTACDVVNFPDLEREIGLKLLENYERATDSYGSGLPIGPMFSHLIGNLVLRDIDLKMNEIAEGRYFRYVDDFVLVAPEEEAKALEALLKNMLKSIGLKLNQNKRIPVTTKRWQEVANFFDRDESSVSWKSFIGQMKQLMLFRPHYRKELESKLRDAEIRIRPLDYSQVGHDSDFLSRMRNLAEYAWFRIRMYKLNTDLVVREGLELRSQYMIDLYEYLQYFKDSDSFGRKISISRIRFVLSRLAYLASPEQLLTITDSIRGIEELSIYASILGALASRDVSDLLRFGSIGAKSVARSLKIDSSPVICSMPKFTEEAKQAYAILLLYGVPLDVVGGQYDCPMIDFCRGGDGISGLFDSPDTYFRELACLHGQDEPDLLRRLLETAFDRNEEIASEMMDLMDMSYFA